ncbi:hypothetical protein GUITHDRAFT_101463 [Guillardia theta CCMP2712]|uniref:MIR domain-containing protein n=1 Tax=Guillardia theta (strain CCMP2712) TaxID=905079 RepID=L1JWQ4_GUITC|nr:hypothetical protein GUITHDRAFT_101463 [Guillardia theta CCMP2712]EKX53016.1 hypothetical protein GUITHDRAFT_101463 [Guillardia theta CCMP2712]|eukprot:XP_005839996.1 hypothetical protein GUITHDRAFT_101463 [Guillardia theta CCMP2712]
MAEGESRAEWLRIGDKLALFSEKVHGFLVADGFIDDSVHASFLDAQHPVPRDFECCLFQVEVKMAYFEQEKLNKFMTSIGIQSLDELEQLQGPPLKTATSMLIAASKEVQRNREDSEFYAGRTVRYGQTFQLKHVRSCKYLTVMYSSAGDVGSENHVEIRLTDGGMGSYFKLQSHHAMKESSEPVSNKDYVEIVPEMLPHLSLGFRSMRGVMPDSDKHSLFEQTVSCNVEGQTWFVSRYHSYQSYEEKPAQADVNLTSKVEASPEDLLEREQRIPLNSGQVIRLLHQDSESFLAVEPVETGSHAARNIQHVTLEASRGFGMPGFSLNPRENPGTAYSLWMVENVDPTLSKQLKIGSQLRLRNIATGGYLFLASNNVNAGWGTARKGSTLSATMFDPTALSSFIVLCSEEKRLFESSRSLLSICAHLQKKSDDQDLNLYKNSSAHFRFDHLETHYQQYQAPNLDDSANGQNAQRMSGKIDGGKGNHLDFLNKIQNQIGAGLDLLGVGAASKDVKESKEETKRMSGNQGVSESVEGWLHVGKRSNSQEYMVSVWPELEELDGWVVLPADQEEINDVNHVVSVNKRVIDYVNLIRSRRSIPTKETNEMYGVFKRLQRFLTVPSSKLSWYSDDAQSADQVIRRQGMLLDLGTVESLVDLVGMHRILPDVSHAHLMVAPDLQQLRELFVNVFQVLLHLVRGNQLIGLYLSSRVTELLQPLLCSVPPGVDESKLTYLNVLLELILEIYKDSPTAISHLDKSCIDTFPQLFASSSSLWRHSRLFQILSSFCTYRSRSSLATTSRANDPRISGDVVAVPDNQLAVKDVILTHSRLLPSLELRGEEVMVKHAFSGTDDHVPLEGWLADVEGRVEFFNSYLDLLSSMVCGRIEVTKSTIAQLEEKNFLSFSVVSAAMMSGRLPTSMRSCFVSLMVNAYLDLPMLEDRCRIKKVYFWSSLDAPASQFSLPRGVNLAAMTVLQGFCLHFIESMDFVMGEDQEDDGLLIQVLKLLYFLVKYGFFSRCMSDWMDVEVPPPVDILCEYLRSRVRAMCSKQSHLHHLQEFCRKTLQVHILAQPLTLLLDNHVRERRARKEDGAEVIFDQASELSNARVDECYKWSCQILDLILNSLVNIRVQLSLKVFEKDLLQGKRFGDAPVAGSSARRSNKVVVHRADFEEIFMTIALDTSFLASNLLHFVSERETEDDGLANIILILILRLFGQRSEVINALKDVQILNEPYMLQYFKDTSNLADQFASSISILSSIEKRLMDVVDSHNELKRKEFQAMIANELEEEEEVSQSPLSVRKSLPFALRREAEEKVVVKNFFDALEATGNVIDTLLSFRQHLWHGPRGEETGEGAKNLESSVSSKPASMQDMRRIMAMRAKAVAAGRMPTSRSMTEPRAVDLLEAVERTAEEQLEMSYETGRNLVIDSFLVRGIDLKVADITKTVRGMVSIVQTCRVDRLLKIQNMLRNLALHEMVLQVLRILTSRDVSHVLQDGSLNDLFLECYLFLSLFVVNNPVNQEIIYEYLEVFVIPQLFSNGRVFLAACDLFLCTFYNNRVLCSRVDDRVLMSIMSAMSQCGNRSSYLQCFEILCCPKNIPLKRNQVRIMQFVITQQEMLPLYLGEDGLSILRADLLSVGHKMKMSSFIDTGDAEAAQHDMIESFFRCREVSPADFNSSPMFYVSFLQLLSACSYGKNSDTERECQRLLPLPRMEELIVNEWAPAPLKAAAINFLSMAHYETSSVLINRAIVQSRASWGILRYLTTCLQNFINREKKVWMCSPAETQAEGTTLLLEAIKCLSCFFTHVYRPNLISIEQGRIADTACELVMKIFSEGPHDKRMSSHLTAALSIFQKRDLPHSQVSKELLKTLLKSSFMQKLGHESVDSSADEASDRIRHGLPLFIEDLRNRVSVQEENNSLCRSFELNPKAVFMLTNQLHKRSPAHRFHYINVLEYIWSAMISSRPLLEAMRILHIDELCSSLVHVISLGADDSMRPALKLCSSLLEKGMEPVQERFSRVLCKPSSGSCFQQLARRLKTAREEVREFRLISNQLIADSESTLSGRLKTLKELLEEAKLKEGLETVERSFLPEVLRFIQALCLRHPLNLQRILGGAVHGVDLCMEVANLVIDMQKSIDSINIDKLIMSVKTLCRLTQGPCKKNQITLTKRSSVGSTLSSLLLRIDDNPKLGYPADWSLHKYRLRIEIANFFTSMLEGHTQDMYIAKRMGQELDLHAIIRLIGHLFDIHMRRSRAELPALQLAHKCYIVLKILHDCVDDSLKEDIARYLDGSSPSANFFADTTGSIEVFRHSVQRVYFCIPALCKQVPPAAKQRVLWSVDRNSDISRLADFCSLVDEVYLEVKHGILLTSISLFRVFHFLAMISHRCYIVNVVLLNLLIFFSYGYVKPPVADPEEPFFVQASPSSSSVALLQLNETAFVFLRDVFASIQLMFEILLFLSYVLEVTPNWVRRHLNEQAPAKLQVSSMMEQRGRKLLFLSRYLLVALSDKMLLWRTITLALTLGLVAFTDRRNKAALLLFSALLLEFFSRSQAIGFVARAVQEGGKALLHTLGMGLVFIFWFGVVGFIFFPNLFQFRKAEIVDGSTQQPWQNNRRVPCGNVWTCMLMVLDQGLRKNDVGEALDKIPWPTMTDDKGQCELCLPEEVGVSCPMVNLCLGDRNLVAWPQSKLWLRILYTFCFFVLISAICLEVIFGIIIDSFKRLREEREEVQKDIERKCFICGLPRNFFDSEAAGGFAVHCKRDHNIWMYMYFLVHLKQKDVLDMDGIEFYVWKRWERRDFSFFPIGCSLNIQGPHKHSAGNLSRQVHELERNVRGELSKFNVKLSHMVKAFTTGGLFKHSRDIRQAYDSIITEIAERRRVLDTYSPLRL